MDKGEARMIAERDLKVYRDMTYENIRSEIGSAESFERVSELGEPYQIEFEFFYDNHREGNIRVTAAVSYSGWTEFFPVSNDFIIAPNGEYIGE